MLGFDPETFGKLNAADYDATQDPGNTAQTVAVISDLAQDARILELAIGTGRIGLPLHHKGHAVSGIEGSQEMIDLLRAKDGGNQLPVIKGDMADVAIEGTFGHIFLVFNTIFNLTSQADQIRLFQNVACKLDAGGTFLIETFVPRFDHMTNDQFVGVRKLEMDSLWLEGITHDPVAQILNFQRLRITNEGMKLVPFVMRYAYPPELDLMAQMAGLQIRSRWGGWDKRSFDASSTSHVTVYQKP